jgi:hypothetical protein
MKILAGAMGVTLLLTFPQAACALAFETIGNAPVAKHADWAEGVVDVVNLKSRVYGHLADSQHTYFYRGGAAAVNEAIRYYAGVRADVRQLILLPGAPKTQSFNGTPIPFDWQLLVPGGRKHPAGKKHAVMTVYLQGTKPRPLEPKPVEKWLADLNSDSFKTRDQANRELQKLGNDAKPFLRAALKPGSTLEARRRLEALLEKLRDLDVTDLEIPQGVTVISVDDQLTVGLQALQNADSNVRLWAVWDLSGLAPYSERVVPALADLLENDRDHHVRRVAAVCLGNAAVHAKSAVAVLKKGLEDLDANVRSACQKALEQIASAKVTPEQEEQMRRERAIATEIDAFKVSTGSKAGSDSGLKAPTQKPRDRLLGQWECMPPEVPGAKMILDVRQGGKLTLTGINKGNTAVLDGTWEVLKETTDRLTIRLQFSSASKAQEWDIELLPNDEMRVNFLSGSSPPVTYKRKG